MANEKELLVSTCLEFLSAGPSSTTSIHEGVNAIWPGAHLTADRVDNALTQAEYSGIVARQTVAQEDGWGLTRIGYEEVEATKTWYTDALGRLAAQIQERATQDFGGVTGEQADLWAATLVKVFSEAITASPEIYSGAVSRAASGNVRPVSLDSARMREAIDQMESPQGTKDFLAACLIAAIDESDPFGNEIVNYVATSCVLHSIIAGRSRAAARNALGTLAGQRIVLDTPILVNYLGPDDTAAHLFTVVRLSLDAGMEVIAPQHVIDELNDLVDRIGDQYIPGLLDGLRGGVSARVYANSVNEQVLELFIEAVEAHKYKGWDEFAMRAKGIAGELESLGITVREHGNTARHYVDRLARELTTIVEAQPNHRGAKQIARDAESMELVWRARRRFEKDRKALWPGGWLITIDRKITPAYRMANKYDSEPLVLTPGQWATLMTEAAPAPEVRELIEAAASFLRQEAVLRIAVKYPPEVALDLALTLDDSAVTETDIRVAQLSLSDLLDGTSPDGYNPVSISTFVSTKRSTRQSIAGAVQRQAFETERKRMAETVTRSAAELTVASSAREAAERAIQSSKAENQRLREEKEAVETASADYVALNGRRMARVGITVTAAIAAAVLFALGLPGFAIGTILGLVIFLNQARSWVKDRSVGAGKLLLALIPELVGVWDLIRGL